MMLFACNKSDNNNNNINIPVADPDAMKYTVNGVADKNMNWTDSAVIPLSIVHSSGRQEKLTLSVADLPANITASFEPQSGTPSFASILSLRSANVQGGSYTVKIKATTEKDSIKTFDFVLTVKGIEACIPERVGLYISKMQRGSSIAEDGELAVASSTEQNQVILKQVFLDGFGNFDIKVNVDCANYKLTVIQQPLTGTPSASVSGSGTFSNNTMKLEFSTYNGPSHINSYTLELTRK
jgi:hypothetical protein